MPKKNSKNNKQIIFIDQTNIGVSAITIGKILIENNLKHPKTKLATNFAIQNGFAITKKIPRRKIKQSLWNKEKVSAIISKKIPILSQTRSEIYIVKQNIKKNGLKSFDFYTKDVPAVSAISAYFEYYFEKVKKNTNRFVKEILIPAENNTRAQLISIIKLYYNDVYLEMEKLIPLI